MSDLLALLFTQDNREQIALVTLYKRATVSKLLSTLFSKERPLKKSDVSDLLVIQANRSQKTSDLLKKNLFFVCLDSCSPFLCPRANRSRCFSLSRCSNGITNSSIITLPLLLRNKSQTCAR